MRAHPRLISIRLPALLALGGAAVSLIAASSAARGYPFPVPHTLPFIMCDNPNHTDYPTGKRAPMFCMLGLYESEYQAQPINGHPFEAVILRKLRWKHWGHHRKATARGLACPRYDGRGCQRTRVIVEDARRIGPAGFNWIYQRTKVERHNRAGHRYFDWYQPGVDY
jgi:hypothetical protein